MKMSLMTGALLLSLMVVPGMVTAQTVQLDLDASTDGIQDFLEISKAGSLSERTIEANLVVQGVTSMTGVSVDITFAATDALTLQSIKEVPGDANFDGSLDLSNEVLKVINQFVGEFTDPTNYPPENFEDGYGRNSYVVFDANGNNAIDLSGELLPVIDEFVLAFNGDPKANVYWTRQVLGTDAQYDESVEVFDTPDKSNIDGDNIGLIDDITAVLLERPGRTSDFGFTGDAVVATITFVVRTNATNGTYEFGFPQAVWIDNNFTGDLDNELMDLNVPATLPSIEVTD